MTSREAIVQDAAIESWRHLMMFTHAAEHRSGSPTHISYYTSADAENWQHLQDDVAFLAPPEEGKGQVVVPSRLSIRLNQDQRYIGLAADGYTITDLTLFGQNGPELSSRVISSGVRSGIDLPVHTPNGDTSSMLVYWDVSGAKS